MAGLASTVLGSLVLNGLVCDNDHVILSFFSYLMMMTKSWHYKWVTSCWDCLGGDELSVITLSDRGWVFQKGRARPLKQPHNPCNYKIHCKFGGQAVKSKPKVNGRPRSSRVSGHSILWRSSVHGQLKQNTKTHGCLNLVGLTLCNLPSTINRLTVGHETFLFTSTLPQPQGEAKKRKSEKEWMHDFTVIGMWQIRFSESSTARSMCPVWCFTSPNVLVVTCNWTCSHDQRAERKQRLFDSCHVWDWRLS